MIIVCPECQSRYKVSAEVISVSGRRMKCMNCSHEWYQDGAGFQDMLDDSRPEDILTNDDTDIDEKLMQIEEALSEEGVDEDDFGEEDFDDEEVNVDIGFVERAEDVGESSSPDGDFEKMIQEASKKIGEGTSTLTDPPVKPKVSKPYKNSDSASNKSRYFTGVFCGFLFFVVVFVLSLVFNKDISQRFSWTHPYYKVMKFDVPVAGEGLVFDRVVINWNGPKLHVKGNVINLRPQVSAVPKIELSFLSVDEEILDQTTFSVKEEMISEEGFLPFEYEIQSTLDIQKETDSVQLRFLPIE